MDDLQWVVRQLGEDEEAVNFVGSLERCYKTDFLARHEAVLGLLRLWQKYPLKKPQDTDKIRDELDKEMERLERISRGLGQKFIEAAQTAQVWNQFIKSVWNSTQVIRISTVKFI